MSRTCEFCGAGQTHAKGTPAYYEEIDGYAHVECAREHDVGDTR